MSELKTAIAISTSDSVIVRGHDLARDIMGKRTVTDLLYMLVCARWPEPAETIILDACLVALAEHGITPSAIVARLIAESVPGEAQVALAAGVLTVGGVFVGTMDGCARILQAGVGEADQTRYCREVIADHVRRRKPVPGFGHPFHKPDDPRAQRLLAIAREVGRFGRYTTLLEALSRELDTALGRHLTLNVTGTIAALLLEIGVPLTAARGMAVVSRCVGLCGHLVEESENPSAGAINKLVTSSFTYQAG